MPVRARHPHIRPRARHRLDHLARLAARQHRRRQPSAAARAQRPRQRARAAAEARARRQQARRRERNRERRAAVDDETIIQAYRTPGHPIAFSAPGTVARYFGISPKKATQLLQQVDSYVLHKEYKKPSKYNPYYVYKRRDLIQADLIDLRDLKSANDGVSFILLMIDVFSRKVWLYPLRRKTAVEVRDAIKQWLDSLPGRKVKVYMTDYGTEFKNAAVKKLFAERGIEQRFAHGTSKSCFAERANKTIQLLVYKWLSDQETTRYIDQLQNFAKTYNKRGHRSLQFMSPNQADKPSNERYVRGLNMSRTSKVQRKEPKYQLGDLVRIKTDSSKISSSRRAYAEQYKGEYFVIVHINRTLPIPMYYLKSLDDQNVLEGGFYGSELSKTQGNVFKIEQVLRRRTRRGKRELLVKWKYFGPQWNEWIPEENVVEVY